MSPSINVVDEFLYSSFGYLPRIACQLEVSFRKYTSPPPSVVDARVQSLFAPHSSPTTVAMKLERGAKNAYIAFLRHAIVADDSFARALRSCSREYAAWARLLRERGRASAEHASTTRLLDSKGHMLNVCDRMCEKVDENEEENVRETREAWEATKANQRDKFQRAGGREGVAEAKMRAKEAKERVKANQRERERREERDRAKKNARVTYATKTHEARSSGACLDWLNMGRCRFADECQFTHDVMSRGALKALAIEVGAETGDVKRERNREEKEERKARARALREQNAEALGGYSSSSEDEDDGEDEDLPGFLKADRAKRAAQALLATNKSADGSRKNAEGTKKKKGASKTEATAKKMKHFNEKQLERKAKFLKDSRNQPFVKRGTKRPAPAEKSASANKKPRHKESARKAKRAGIPRTKFD